MKNRRGFAVIMSVAMVFVLAIGMTGLSVMFGVEGRRTRAALAETQLRQMLLIGAAAAENALENQARPGGPIALPLPAVLDGRDAGLSFELMPPVADGRIVRVTATVNGMHAEQQLRLRAVERRWELIAADLQRQR